MFARAFRASASAAKPLSGSLRVFWLLAFFSVALSAGWRVNSNAQTGAANQSQTNAAPLVTLELGKPIERELAGGQRHGYQVKLEAGQYLRVVAEQRGVDVVLSMFKPDGTKSFEIDSPNGTEGEESIATAADIAGIYLIEVTAPDTKVKPGKYQIQVGELRKLTEEELKLPSLLQSIKREMAGGQSHDYSLALGADEYLYFFAKQNNLDVMLTIFDPYGNRLARFDNTYGARLSQDLMFVTTVAGVYRLEVKAVEKEAKAGSYELRIVDWHFATPRDRDLAEAEKCFNEEGFLREEIKFNEAMLAAEKALALYEKIYGSEHVMVANALQSLAFIHHERGELAKSEQCFLREIKIREKIDGPKSIWIVRLSYHLANLYLDMGEYTRAEQFYQRALDLRKNFSYERLYPARAAILNGLALAYRNMGSYEKAEPLFQSSQETFAKLGGPENSENLDRAYVFNNLGVLYHWKGDVEKAVAAYERSLGMMEKVESIDVVAPLSGLARIYTDKQNYDRAEPLYQRALAIRTKSHGADGYSTAFVLRDFAQMYGAQGNYDQASSFYQRSIEIFERLLGPEHPDLAGSLLGLAKVERDHGNLREALALFEQGVEITEKNFRKNLGAGSEQQKLNYLARFNPLINDAITLHARYAPGDTQARRMALTSLLRFKGRGLDEMTDTIAFLRRSTRQEDQTLLEQLASARSRLAVLTLRGPEERTMTIYRALLIQLGEEIDRLESELSSKSDEIRARLQPVTLAAVQAALPAESAVVEFALYSPMKRLTRQQDAHYLAYVLSSRDEPRWVELGEAAVIDQAVDQLRQSLCRQQPGESRCRPLSLSETRASARKLDELVMRPIRRLLGAARHVLISPDGALNLVPFAALVDEHNSYLTEHYSFTYLTSGRDLLRLQIQQPDSNSAAVLVAAPAFDSATGGTVMAQVKAEQARDIIKHPASGQQPNVISQSVSMAQLSFPPLPGTAAEVETLKKLLPQADLLLGPQATEAALKQLHRPRILHIATHGFFLKDLALPDAPHGPNGSFSEALASAPSAPTNGEKIENPLLRSGLALAGANRHQGDEDGILTALEAVGLDLWGTKLVALSACNTGVGEIKNGDGVYGLRRAFVLAGSETQVMSLWSVSDQGTKELMVAYYKRLLHGEGRGEALRQVQLQLLKQPKRRHPYYWASFIQSGEWANLDGRR
ncbi:MAG: CHAT domain-containing protein [Acidobacteria bacterium]|nr:CHAT domain-containing protein [Acidobacteriota bacterium]MBI3423209.1 CHAT domain-containing protein [Acidobacteriota bacterium]